MSPKLDLAGIPERRDTVVLGSCPVIVVQHSTQALSSLDRTGISHMTWFGAEELIAETLVRTFPMVMGDELMKGGPQGLFSEQDQAVQTGLFDRAHKSFGMRVEIRGARW